jgi:hypothetical protein
LQIGLFLLALPALVTPFVSFTYNTSPLEVVDDPPRWGSGEWILYLVALPYFFAFPILLWKARRLVFAITPGRGEQRAVLLSAIGLMIPTLIVLGEMVSDLPQLIREGKFDSALMLSVAFITLFAGFAAAAWRCRCGDWLGGIEVLLIIGYLSNAGMTLLAFHDRPELGYWLTVPVAASFAAEMLLPRPQKL